METRTKIAAVIALLTAAAMTTVVACDDSGSNAVKEPSPGTDSGGPGVDSGGPQPGSDSGTLPDGAPSDCFTNPKTHFEIINACTDAVKITKNPTLPLLYPDGGLPPLP
jgi:hypothetical protein